MFRNGVKDVPLEYVNFLFDEGGLGDNICRIIVISYLVKRYEHLRPFVWVPDYFLPLAKHFLPNVNIRNFTMAKKQYNNKLPGRKTSNTAYNNMRTHMVDHAFHILANKDVDTQFKNYPKLCLETIDVIKFNLPNDYIVITAGYTAKVREFIPETINNIIKYCKIKGYDIVFLGNEITPNGIKNDEIIGNFNTEIQFKQGLNLIGNTSLLEAGKIMGMAKVVIGLDNGLLHLAACTDVPIVAAYTTVDPKYRLPYRYRKLGYKCYPIVPDSSLVCKFCQSEWDFVFDHDFRTCYYKKRGLDKEIQFTKQKFKSRKKYPSIIVEPSN